MSSGARVLVTGGTGFVGRAIIRDLAEHDHDVVALVRGENPRARLDAVRLSVAVHSGDLRDRASLESALVGCNAVVHAAALVDPALQSDETEVFRINRDAAVALGELARTAKVRRFVFVSSIAAMGFFSGRATSQSPCKPVMAYGRSKLAAEEALLALARSDFDVIVLRLPTVYGPGERYNFLAWVRAIDRGLFRIIGHGTNIMPLCTTANAARAARGAIDGRLRTGVYLVSDAKHYSVARIHRAICAALGKRPPRIRLPKSLATAAGFLNEVVAARMPAVPTVLTRARVRTLTVDQPFEVQPLIKAGIELDARLEEWVKETVEEYRRRGELR